MRLSIAVFCFLSLFICSAQNYHEGVVLDSETKKPIEFVNVYNGIDYTISNSDGRYAISSSQDSVFFYRIGYEKLQTALSQLNDTIYLKESVFELNEVVVTNAKTLWQKVKDSIKTNYLFEPYNESFFLRGILKYNDTITRIQDIQGKLRRSTLLYGNGMELTNKDFLFEFENMRKIGVVKDLNKVYFKFPTLYGLFSSFVRLNATGDAFTLTEKPFESGERTKYEFVSDPNLPIENTSGYYVINTNNNAIEEFHLIATPKNPPYTKNKRIKYRTDQYELTVFFKKHPVKKRYYMSTAKSREIVRITNDQSSFSTKYEVVFILNTQSSFGNYVVQKNISATKDIFKLKYPYDGKYWTSQNQLLLTEEMEAFITKISERNNEFKVRSNIKK